MADCETGELHLDSETGERVPLSVQSSKPLNDETGECEPEPMPPKRSTFKVPNFRADAAKKSHFPNDGVRKKMPPVCSSHDISPIILFLMPTIFLYPIITIIPVVLEVLIHMWAHRKNKHMQDTGFYYKSPLHLYVREFCAKCREDTYMSKIGKLQDKRTMKYEYLKRIVT